MNNPATRRSHTVTAAFVLLGALAGCGDWAPPKPPPVAEIAAYPHAMKRPGKDGGRSENEAFARLRDAILDRWLADDPSLGRQVGLHAYDGKIADYSAAGITARMARVEKDRA